MSDDGSFFLMIIALAAMVSCSRVGDIRDAAERISPPPIETVTPTTGGGHA